MSQVATRVAVVAPNGRMGAAVCQLAAADAAFRIVGRIVPPGEHGGVLLHEVDGSDVDVMIDFSHREAVRAHADWCARHGVAWVLGTTGLNEADNAALHAALAQTVVFQASNFSIGVALLADLSARAAAVLGVQTDVEIVEAHHHHKRDAPSGTALTLGKAVAAARGQVLADVVANGREGLVGERAQGEIGMHALRLADVVGRHAVHFGWSMEGLVLTHEARDRRVFAAGALRAAAFAVQQQRSGARGRLGMGDLIAPA
jgi:4-hydroxy-tetrahydrodipicolinate reductase